MLPPEPIPILAVNEAGLQLVRGSSRSVEWDTCRKRLVTIISAKRLDLLPDEAEERVAGPATEQHDDVHRYTVEIHCHGRQRGKGVESNAL